jgi:phosphatidylglycerol---prolipoprotein diacylglyceryl transferase
MGKEIRGEKTLDASLFVSASEYIRFTDLGLSPNLFEVGGFALRWYSLAYIIGIFAAYWLVRRMIRLPGAPMAERHTDDLLFWSMLGVILGGRLGYVLFYNLEAYADSPLDALKLWEGGMSFHGGLAGVLLAALWVCRRNGLSFLRVMDYIAVGVPVGMLLGRLANFINGELWGRVTDVPWGVIFCDVSHVAGQCISTGDPRHPSQLYQAGLEGLLMLILLNWLFWRTQVRYWPGFLAGMFAIGLGVARFVVEFVREPDFQRMQIVADTGLTMGQWLTLPVIAVGLWAVLTAKGRRQRVEPFAGTDSVA